ncbi:MAG: ATP-dependent metallopeptidase FtsH/Yme1/Tma family protein, partial [bacterium]|nr:ATP-dependent metallopeptidase FtsH/Yme1/Tma family protein [bacterium]
MKAFSKNLIVAVAILLLITGLFALFGKPFEAPKVVSLTQLAQDINEERVEKVVVSGNKLEISYKDKGSAVSQKETESGLSETLLNYGVQQEKIGGVAIEQKEENG